MTICIRIVKFPRVKNDNDPKFPMGKNCHGEEWLYNTGSDPIGVMLFPFFIVLLCIF